MLEFINTEMLSEEECYPVDQIPKHPETDGMMNIEFDSSCEEYPFHIPEHHVWGLTSSIS